MTDTPGPGWHLVDPTPPPTMTTIPVDPPSSGEGVRRKPYAQYENTRYLMVVEGRRIWMTFQDCYRALDAGFVRVVDGGVAIDLGPASSEERPLTEREKNAITDAADEFSGSK